MDHEQASAAAVWLSSFYAPSKVITAMKSRPGGSGESRFKWFKLSNLIPNPSLFPVGFILLSWFYLALILPAATAFDSCSMLLPLFLILSFTAHGSLYIFLLSFSSASYLQALISSHFQSLCTKAKYIYQKRKMHFLGPFRFRWISVLQIKTWPWT